MASTPRVGDIIDGFMFSGGNPASESSWKPIDNPDWQDRNDVAIAASKPVASNAPKVGEVLDGYVFNGGDPADEANWSAEGRTALGTAKDIGISALKSAISVPEAAVGLLNIPTLGLAGKAVESAGVDFKGAKSILDDQYSDAQKIANQNVDSAKGFIDTGAAMLQNPSTILHGTVESVAPMLAGGVIGRGVAAVAPKIAGWAAGAIGEGVIGAGSAAEGFRQATKDGELTAGQAGAALASGIGTGVLGAIGGRIANKLGIDDVDTMLVKGGSDVTEKGVIRRLVEGGISEGALEEMPQSIQEQIWQNAAFDKPLLEGVPEAAAKGLILGGVMGGGVNAMSSLVNAPDADTAIESFNQVVGNLSAETDNASKAIDEFHATQRTEALGLPNMAGPALVTFPDGSTMTGAEAEQYRLNQMTQPADVESVPLTNASQTDQEALLASDGAQDELVPAQAQDERTMPTARDVNAPNQTPADEAGQRAMLNQVRAEVAAGRPNSPIVAVARQRIGDAAVDQQIQRVTASFSMDKQEQTAADRAATPPISVALNDNGVPIVRTESPEQTQAVTQGLRDAGIKTHTVDGNTIRLNKNTEKATVENVVSRINTQFSETRERTASAVTADSILNLEGTTNGPQATETPVPPLSGQAQPSRPVPPEQNINALPLLGTSKIISRTKAKAIQQLGRLTGTTIKFFHDKNDTSAEGFFRPKEDPNVVYINTAKPDLTMRRVFGHEVTHQLRTKHPEAWAQIEKIARATMKPDALVAMAEDYFSSKKDIITKLTGYKNQGKAADFLKLTTAEAGYGQRFNDDNTEQTVEQLLMDELVSDLGGNRFGEEAFWEQVFQNILEKEGTEKGKGIIQRLMDSVIKMIKAFNAMMRDQNFKADELVDVDQVRTAMANAYATMIMENRGRDVGSELDASLGDETITQERALGGSVDAKETPRRPEFKDQTLPTRWPTAADLTPSVDDDMITDIATLKLDQTQYQQAVDGILEEPGFGGNQTEGLTLDQKAEFIVERLKDNLLWLFDQIPEAMRNRTKLWYDGARKIAEAWADKYELSNSQAAGMLAVLSPQKDWYMNVTMAERIVDVISTQLDHRFDKKTAAASFNFMVAKEEDPQGNAKKAKNNRRARENYAPIQGKTLREVIDSGDLTQIGMWIRAYDEAYHSGAYTQVLPEGNFGENMKTDKGDDARRAWGSFDSLGKAASIYMDGTPENINTMLGREHKVRNFYNNIFAPSDPRFTTIDTHAVAADMIRPLGGSAKPVSDAFGATGGTNQTGLSGTYALHYEAYRRAAELKGVLPREMQSITWEAVRGLFRDTYKTAENNEHIDGIWQEVEQGEKTVAQARAEILEHAGGIDNPTWWRSDDTTYETVLSDKSYAQSKESFVGQKLIFEVAPNPDDAAATDRWNALGQRDKEHISHEVAWKIIAKAMISFGKMDTTNMKGELHSQLGGYEDNTNPSYSIWLNKYISGSNVGKLLQIVGHALRQKEMMRTSPKPFDTGRKHDRDNKKLGIKKGDKIMSQEMDAIAITLPSNLSMADVDAIYQKLRAATNNAVGGHTTQDGLMIVLNRKEWSGLDGMELGQKIDAALDGEYFVDVGSIHVDFASKGKNDYDLPRPSRSSKVSGGARTEPSLRARADQLRADADALIDQLVSQAEQRPNAASSGLAGAGAGSSYQASESRGVSATGIHYSKQERKSLAASMFGTGLQGAELERVKNAADERLRHRIYFYTNTGKGINPEFGVGPHAHKADLSNLYDIEADPQDLGVGADRNLFESRILDAGFDGFISQAFGAAVLIGPRNVDVEYLGTGVKPEVDQAGKAEASQYQKDLKAVAANMLLPSGQNTGARWKELMAQRMPSIDVSHLNDDEKYYKSGIVKKPVVQFSPSRAVDTNSPEFRKWFGDSKVVDADGNPLVVYHGTASDVAKFDPKHSGKNYPSTGGQKGFYFTSRPGTAAVYAEQAARGGKGGENTVPVYLSAENPYVRNTKEYPDKFFDYNRSRLFEEAERRGADGIIVHGNGRSLYVVLKPTQIKSAISNTGEFSDRNADIRFSERRWEGTRTRDDHLVPSTPYYFENDQEIDLASYEGKPVRIKVGRHEERYGMDHLYQNGQNNPQRDVASVGNDKGEGHIRELLRVLREANQEFPNSSKKITLRNQLQLRAVVLSDSGDYWNVITVVPARRDQVATWGSPKKVKAPTLLDPVAATSTVSYYRDTPENSSQEARSGLLKSQWFDVNQPDGGSQVSVAYKKKRTIRESLPRNLQGQPINAAWSNDLNLESWDYVKRQLLDKLVDTKHILGEIRKAGVAIKDAFDPYLQETLYHGRAAKGVADFAESELKPLIAEMHLKGIEMQELEDYLWARHAGERNAQVASIGGMADGGSGLTNAEAAAILSGQAVTKNGRTIQIRTAKMPAYQTLAQKVKAINDSTLDLLVAEGLETQATVNAWKAAYSNYVPLKRDMESDDNFLGAFNLGSGTGQGFSVKGSASKRALGSNRAVIDILANVAMQRERAIVRAEKNKIAMATYGLALTAPNPEFWIPINPKGGVADIVAQLVKMGVAPQQAQQYADNLAQQPTTQTVNSQGVVTSTPMPFLAQRPDVLSVRVNGEDRFLMFSSDEKGQQMVRNLKNLDAEQMGVVMSNVAKVTRYFAAINTQYNPIFGLTNFIRDSGSALLNLSSTPLAGNQGAVAGNVMSALRGIYIDLRDHRAGNAPTSVWAQEFEEFQREGGQTGYMDSFVNSADRARAIRDELTSLDRSKWLKLGDKNPILGWLSDYNTAIENAWRLSAYKVAKEQGMSKQQAASLAKNATVNFNKKGLAATQLGALYAFFNAAVQGSARIAETMVKDGKLTPAGQKIILGGLIAGSAQAIMFAWAGWDDEEPPQFIREKNFIIPTGNGKYLQIPYPLGYHVIPNLGRVSTEFVLGGFKKPAERMIQLAMSVVDGFNPLGSSSVAQTIAPTIADPIIAMAENKDFTGKNIYKEDFNKMKPTAGWTRTKDTASDIAKGLSYGINYATGGGKYGIGAISPTPDQIDYLIGQATGGVGREANKLYQAGKTIVSGEELPEYKIPVAGRFYGSTTGQASETSKFYSSLKRIGAHASTLKEMEEAGDQMARVEYLQENPDARMVKQADKASRELGFLKRQKRDAVEKGDKERVKKLEAQITAKVQLWNQRLSEKE